MEIAHGNNRGQNVHALKDGEINKNNKAVYMRTVKLKAIKSINIDTMNKILQ